MCAGAGTDASATAVPDARLLAVAAFSAMLLLS
jgi:hypothetical protein